MGEERRDMRRQVSKFTEALSSFSSSPDSFRILTSLAKEPAPSPSPSLSPSTPPRSPSTLYVLDSSFNPPTLAHLHIARSALVQDHGPAPKRLLLLLATRNADKAPTPAAFEQRLALMTVLADDLRRGAQPSPASPPAPHSAAADAAAVVDVDVDVDIGVTKHPFFADKAAAITASRLYPGDMTQVHLVGYDTLVRLLDSKYYYNSSSRPDHDHDHAHAPPLAVLDPFLARHRLRVTYRTAGLAWGAKAEQDAYLAALARGERETEGGRRDWAERIELVEAMGREGGDGGDVVSSTRAREAVRTGDDIMLRKLVSKGVADWVLHEKLYALD